MENKRLNFFADINKQVFIILGGIVAIATLIPLFINKIESIFGLPIRTSYYLFVLLYFIFPVIFYLLYCSIYDYVGFLKLIPERIYKRISPTIWKTVELLIILLAFYWLCTGTEKGQIFCLLLYIISLTVFFYFLLSRKYRVNRGTWKEFQIIGLSLVFIFTLFFASKQRTYPAIQAWKPNTLETNIRINSKTLNVNDTAFVLFERQKLLGDSLLKPVDSLVDALSKRTLRAAIRNPNRNLALVQLDSTDTEYFSSIFYTLSEIEITKEIPPNGFASERKRILEDAEQLWSADDLLDKKMDTSFRIYHTLLSAQSYLQTIGLEKYKLIKTKWARLLNNLQIKGMTWFFFLVTVCLCLWLQSMTELSAECEKYINATDEEKEKIDQQILKIRDNSDQIRSLFYIVLLLVIPFFKEINEKTISLSMPFLDFGIEKFDRSEKNETTGISDYSVELNKIRKQLLAIQEFTEHQRIENNINKKRLSILARYGIFLEEGQTEYEKLENEK